jgi:hypothetical protein
MCTASKETWKQINAKRKYNKKKTKPIKEEEKYVGRVAQSV